jgi:uncharacterized membrane protein
LTTNWVPLLVFAAALGSGLIGGVFFAFSTFVMRALAALPPAHGIAAMQSINVVVLNRIFLGAFVGTALFCAMLAVYATIRWSEPGSGWLLAGGTFYVAGTFLVTLVCNVPRNDALARLDPTEAASVESWRRYLAQWTAWNHVRTVSGIAASVALVRALCVMA